MEPSEEELLKQTQAPAEPVAMAEPAVPVQTMPQIEAGLGPSRSWFSWPVIVLVVVLLAVLAGGAFYFWQRLKANAEYQTLPASAKPSAVEAELPAERAAFNQAEVNPFAAAERQLFDDIEFNPYAAIITNPFE